MIKLALVQAPACADIHENMRTLQHYARCASQAGCSAVCFPECFLTGYLPEEAPRLALDLSSPHISALESMAKDLSIDILAGFMQRDGDRFFIAHGIFLRDGSLSLCRKTHLGRREMRIFTPGSALEVFPLSCGLQAGIQLCVETHYPEISQTLALRGAQLIFAPHAVPRVSGNRKTIWGKYIPARSYDNRVYMACCNLWDEARFGGGCLVTDPRGEEIASCYADAPSMLIFEADPDLPASFRNRESKRFHHFYPLHRRKELYE